MKLQSDTIGAWAEAHSKMQGELEHASKNSENDFLHNKYADLASVQDASRAALANNGMSITQLPYIAEDGRAILHTRLYHSSGEWVACEWLLIPTKPDPQGQGTALSYARRYCWAAVVGIAQSDDDAQYVSQPAGKPAAKPKTQKPKPPPPNPPEDMAPTIAAAEGDIEAALALPHDEGWALLDSVVATVKGSPIHRPAKMDLAAKLNRKRLDLIVVASAGLPTTEDVDRWEKRLSDLMAKLQDAKQGEDYAKLVLTASTGLKARREQLVLGDGSEERDGNATS